MVARSLACIAVVVVSSAASLGIAHAQTRAVIELFTSQGCSSCPAADKLLAEFASDPSLVSISLPIDIWDYLGWKDTLASPRHTARQRAYSKVRGDREVYTPQVVVNGSLHVLGSDKAAIERAIGKTRENSTTLSIPVKVSAGGGRLNVAIPDHADAAMEVWVLGVSKAVTVAIKRGENKGKTITYHNVARRWHQLDTGDGKVNSWSVPVEDFGGGDINGAAVLVQTGTSDKPSVMLGAAMASLR